MIDVSSKEPVIREAVAEGWIDLSPETVAAVIRKEIKKGDPMCYAQAAGMLAVKQTDLLIPHCHPLPIEAVDFDFEVAERGMRVQCMVKARARTGVEMEALVGVTTALCTLWDIVKYLEKDALGQYPATRITNVRVLSKKKGVRGVD